MAEQTIAQRAAALVERLRSLLAALESARPIGKA